MKYCQILAARYRIKSAICGLPELVEGFLRIDYYSGGKLRSLLIPTNH